MRLRIARIVLAVAAVVVFAGADTITLVNLTANPKGKAQTLYGDGAYTVDPANTFSQIIFYGSNTGTGQLNSIPANPVAGTWDGTLQVVAGNYDGYAIIYTSGGGVINRTKSNVKNVNVK